MVHVSDKELHIIKTYPIPKGGLPVNPMKEAARTSRKQHWKTWHRLNTVEGISYSRIAKMYEVSKGTVASAVFRYKRQLQRQTVKVDRAR